FRQCESFLFAVGSNVSDFPDGLRRMMYREYFLIQHFITVLKHPVVLHILLYFLEFFNAIDTLDTHGLRDLHSVCAPWCDHFLSWSQKFAFQRIFIQRLCSSEQPYEFFDVRFW